MKAIDRLFQYFEFKGIKPTRFEKDFGLSTGYLGTQLKRNGHLGEDVLNKIIANCLDLNPLWLIMGTGNMIKSVVFASTESDNQMQLVPDYDDFELNENEFDVKLILRSIKSASIIMRIKGNFMSPDYNVGMLVAGKNVMNKNLIIYGKDYIIFTDEYKIIRRIQKSDKKKISFGLFV